MRPHRCNDRISLTMPHKRRSCRRKTIQSTVSTSTLYLSSLLLHAVLVSAFWCTTDALLPMPLSQSCTASRMSSKRSFCSSPDVHHHHRSSSFLSKRPSVFSITSIRSSTPLHHQQQDETPTRTSSDKQEDDSSPLSLVDLNIQLETLAQKCVIHNNKKDNEAASSSVVQYASQCQDLFQQSFSNPELPTPTIGSFHILLRAWTRCAASLAEQRNQQRGKTTATAAGVAMDMSSLLAASLSSNSSSGSSTMVPTATTLPIYTAHDAMEHATKLVLNQDESPSVQRDLSCYTIVMDGWSKTRLDEAPHQCEVLLKQINEHPTFHADTATYHAVLDAWAHSPRDDAMDRVLKVYSHMDKLSQEPASRVQPNLRTVNMVVTAFARHAAASETKEQAMDYALEAHRVLKELTTIDPDVQTYTCVMDAYARCGTAEATQCAEDLLEELKANPLLEPNVRTYSSLMTAYSKTPRPDSPHKAEALLQEMKDAYYSAKSQQDDGRRLHADDTAKPNMRTYTIVIQCWGRSRDPTKAQRALKILKSMREMYQQGDKDVRPNLITYNAAIDACARCNGDSKQQTEALKIAFAILKTIELDPDFAPNQVTFATLVKATAFLMPAGPERNDVARAVFEKARTAGMIDLTIVKNVRKAVDNQVMRELFQEMKDPKGYIDYNAIPPSWSRNVRVS